MTQHSFFLMEINQQFSGSVVIFAPEKLTSQDLKVLSVCPQGTKSGPVEGPAEGNCSLVKTEATVKSRKRADAPAGRSR